MTESRMKRFDINPNKTIEVPCKPMKKILRQANMTKIDFFSLDVEGAELIVLDTMDWSIQVSVFLIEVSKNRQKIRQVMISKGYRLATFSLKSYCKKGKDCTDNDVFLHKNFVQPK